MKKVLLVVLVFALVFVSVPVLADDDYNGFETVNIRINGEVVNIPAEYGAVIIVENRTMVPVRFVSQFLGFEVDWDGDSGTVIFANRTDTVVLRIGLDRLLVNTENIQMDVVAMIYDNRTYIPIRFFAESIGFEVDWDEATQTVLLDNE